MSWYTFFSGFFFRITPYEKVLKNSWKRCSCVREFGRETTSFMFGARLMNANLEFHRKNIGKNHQTAGHHIEVEWNWWTRSIIMYTSIHSQQPRFFNLVFNFNSCFFHDEWMEWMDLAHIRRWTVREHNLKLCDYDAKAFHSFTSCHYK